MLAKERAQQRGFSRPVASDDSHHAGSLQGAAESLHQGVRADRHAYVLGSHHLIAAPFGHLEPQRHRAVGSDDQAEPGQPLETPAPTLGLFAVLSGDVARDVVLLVRDGALLLLERTLLRQPARSEEHTSELQSRLHLVCRLLLEKKKLLTIMPHSSLFSVRVSTRCADCVAVYQ